jgi:hypothetical protein
VALALFLGLQQIDVSGQAARARLSGVLADLARAVPQEQAAAAGRAIPETLAPGSLPKSVQDALHGQRLRINDLNEVQVYILGDELSGQNRQALAASGVTIEIADPPRRRVQRASRRAGSRRSRSCHLSITSGCQTTRFVARARR